MKTRKNTTKKAAAVKPETPEITINIDAIDSAIEEAIGTLMAVQSLMHMLVDAVEEGDK